MPMSRTLVLALLLATAVPAGAATTPVSTVADPIHHWTVTRDPAGLDRAVDGRIAEAKAAVERMLKVRGKRTIANTLQPFDDAVMALGIAGSQAGLAAQVSPDSAIRATAEAAGRRIDAYDTELSLDRRLYDALLAIDASKADAATRTYLDKTLLEFRLAGVDKDDATRRHIQALQESLTITSQAFSRNIRSDKRTIEATPAELAGLPQDFIERHKPNADGKVTLTMEYPDAIPVLTYATSDSLRHRMYMSYNNRAYPQNMAVLDSMLARRQRLANLAGYATWADHITANKMVGTAARASAFIDQVVEASGKRAEAEYQVLLGRLRQVDPTATVVQPWQSTWLSEQVRKENYDFDSQSMRPYLPYKQVRQGVLDVNARLFGVEFRPRTDVAVWHPSVECFEMFEGGKLVGRFYLDMHPRADKYNHAAQFGVRTGVAGRAIPEAALVCNFPGGDANDPGLMEFDDVETFFHEFGHLVHSLFAGRGPWAGVGGTRTERDFVEAPSQMLEEWARDPAVLATFAKHHETGAAIPAELVQRMRRANEFGKALGVRRQMVYARTSLSFYDRPAAEVNTTQLIADITRRYQPFPYVEGTHFQTAFGHLDGYSAVYYTYMWSLVIAKDLFSQFDEKNLLAPAVAKRYRDTVLAPGGSKPAAQLVQDFLGRPFDFRAYQAWLSRDAQ
jgi:thimet oligopeptidase